MRLCYGGFSLACNFLPDNETLNFLAAAGLRILSMWRHAAGKERYM